VYGFECVLFAMLVSAVGEGCGKIWREGESREDSKSVNSIYIFAVYIVKDKVHTIKSYPGPL